MSNIGNSRQFVITIPGNASNISFDGSQCVPPLTATNVQDAICEVNSGGGGGGSLQDAYDAGAAGVAGQIDLTAVGGPLTFNADVVSNAQSLNVNNDASRTSLSIRNDSSGTTNILFSENTGGQVIVGDNHFIVGDVNMQGTANNHVSIGGPNAFGQAPFVLTDSNTIIGKNSSVGAGSRNYAIGDIILNDINDETMVVGRNMEFTNNNNVYAVGENVVFNDYLDSMILSVSDQGGASFPKFGAIGSTVTNTLVRKGFSAIEDHCMGGYTNTTNTGLSCYKASFRGQPGGVFAIFSDPFEFGVPVGFETTVHIKAWVQAVDRPTGEVSTSLYTMVLCFRNVIGVIQLAPSGGLGYVNATGGAGNENGRIFDMVNGSVGGGVSNIPAGANGIGINTSSPAANRAAFQITTDPVTTGANYFPNPANITVFSKLKYQLITTPTS